MDNVNGKINIDDYARHLRAVNLTIVLLSVGLVIGRTLSRNTELVKAHSDLQIISNVIDKVDENWLYDYTKRIVDDDLNRNGKELPARIFVNLPLKGETVLAEIDLPIDKWTVNCSRDCTLFDYSNPNELATTRMTLYMVTHHIYDHTDSRLENIRTRLKMQMLRPRSVMAFKNLWDFLGCPHYVYYAQKLDESAVLHIVGDNSSTEETSGCEIQLENSKKRDVKGWILRSQLKKFHEQQEPFELEMGINQDNYICKFVVDEFTTHSEQQGLFWGKKEIKYSEEKYRIEIGTESTRRQIYPLKEFIFINGINRPEASFEVAFPELNDYVEKYPTLSVPSLISVLQELIESGQEYFEIIGLKVPSIYLTYFGLGLIIVISFYYTIHLGQLVFLLKNGKWKCSIAWVGIYHGVIPKLAMLICSIIIPISIVVYLSYCEMNVGKMNKIIIACVSTQALISIIALQKIIQLWIFMRRQRYRI